MRLSVVPDPDYESFRIVLIEPNMRSILMTPRGDRWALPRVSIPRWTRASCKIVHQIEVQFGSTAVILDELETPFPAGPLILAELVDVTSSKVRKDVQWRLFKEQEIDELFEHEEELLRRLLDNGATGRGPFSRLGWIEDVVQWSAHQIGVDPRDVRVHQMNGACDSTLVHLILPDGRSYWYKASAGGLDWEYSVTQALQILIPEHVPTVIANHPEWSGWLMEDAGQSLDNLTSVRPRLMEEVARRLAQVHVATQNSVASLIQSGCLDQRLRQLLDSTPEVLELLDRAASTAKSGRLAAGKLPYMRGLQQRLQDILAELGSLEIPSTLVHGDLTYTNILVGPGTCIFTDWREAAVGHPLANLEQLRLLVLHDRRLSGISSRVLSAYEREWLHMVSADQVRHGLSLIPPISLLMYLHSRRRWFSQERLNDPEFMSFARGMARRMERALLDCQERLSSTA
jgi:hypothetical protein